MSPTRTKIVYIYGLYDPRTGYLRYVGKAQDPQKRLHQHLSSSHLKNFTHKTNWIKEVLASGFKPELKILQIVNVVNWEKVERRWITLGRGIWKEKFTNTRDGGQGVTPQIYREKAQRQLGTKLSEETKRKMSQAKLGKRRSLEVRYKMSIDRKGVPKPKPSEFSSIRQGIVYKTKRIKSSRFIGVSVVGLIRGRCTPRWVASIRKSKQLFHLGYFSSEIDAAKAYDKKALELYGSTAKLNFPK